MSDWKIRYDQAVKELQDYLFYNKGISTNLFFRTRWGVSGTAGVFKQITIACDDAFTIVISSWIGTEKYPQSKLTEAVERFLEIPNGSYSAGWRVGWPTNFIQWVDPKGIAQKTHVICDSAGTPLDSQYNTPLDSQCPTTVKPTLDTILKEPTARHASEAYLFERSFYYEHNAWQREIEVTATENEDCKFVIKLSANIHYDHGNKWRLDVIVRPDEKADSTFCEFAAKHEGIDVTEKGDFSSLYYERVEDCFNELSVRIMTLYETLQKLDDYADKEESSN